MVYDGTTSAGHGYFEVNGTVVPQATPTWVTQAQLAQTTFVAGTAGASDDARMIAYDGQLFSNNGVWSKVAVTAVADAPPQMSLPSGNVVSIVAGHSVAVTSLFSASDPDGDALTYMVYDGTTSAGHGHFVVNGTVIPQATPTWVTQAQLAQTTFVAGTAGASDDVRMIVYDGQLFSNNGVWSKVQVNAGALSAPLATLAPSAIASDGQGVKASAPHAAQSTLNDFFHGEERSGGFVFGASTQPVTPLAANVATGQHGPAVFDFAALNHTPPEAANSSPGMTSLAGMHDDHSALFNALHDFHLLS
jgi:hypothetical protein